MINPSCRSFLLVFPLLLAVAAGCASSRVVADASAPEVVMDGLGRITFNDREIRPGRIAAALRSAGVPRDQEIAIQIPDEPDRRLMGVVSAELVRHGYTRAIFVKNRKATATTKPEP